MLRGYMSRLLPVVSMHSEVCSCLINSMTGKFGESAVGLWGLLCNASSQLL